MVYTERTETAAVSRGTSHASAVSTQLRWRLKNALLKAIIHVDSHASAVSLLESGEQRNIKQYRRLPARNPYLDIGAIFRFLHQKILWICLSR